MTRTMEPVLPADWPFSEDWGIVRRFGTSAYLSSKSRSEVAGFRATLRERWAETPPREREESIMGRLLTAIPVSAPVSVDVPEDVAKELDELYAYMVEHPDFMAQATFTKDDEHNTPDPAAAGTFLAQAKEWGRTRTVGEGDEAKPAPLEIRKSPSRTLPDHVIRFNIRTPLTEEEIKANAEKNAKAKAAREAKAAAEAKTAKK